MLLAWDGKDVEPASTCGAWGWAALLGEWDLSGPVANGAVAVVLDIRDTAPDLDMETLVDDLLPCSVTGPEGAGRGCICTSNQCEIAGSQPP